MNIRLFARRAAGSAACLVALYSALGFFALPALIQHQAQSLASEQLHRKLSIANVEFNPFTLALAVEGVKLMEPAGTEVFFSTDRLALDLSAESLWRLAPIVQQLRIKRPYLHLVRDNAGHYSIDDLLALIARQPASPEPARFSLNNVALEGGRIVFVDQPAGATHTVEALRLGVPSLSSMPAQVRVFVEPLLSAKINGAPIHLKGKVRPFAEPKDMALELDLDDLDLARYLEYLPNRPRFKLSGARLDAKLTASFRQPRERGPSLVLGGHLALKQTALTDGADAPLIKLAALDVDLGSLDVFAGKFDLARIAIDGLDGTLVRDAQGQLNLAQWGAPPAPAPAPVPTTTAATGSGMRVTLRELTLRNGALRYTEPGMHTELDQVTLRVQGVAADTAKRTVAIAAISSDSAHLALRRERAAPMAAAAASSDAPYALSLAKLAIDGWSVDLDDRTHAEPLALSLAPLALTVQAYSSAPGVPMLLDLQTGAGKAGKLSALGTLALAPFKLDLALEVDKVSLLPLQPYASESVNLRLTQAQLSGKGRVALATAADGSLAGGFKGDASVDRVTTVDKTSTSDFVSWKALALSGMDVQIAPFAMSVDKVALSDFFARVIIDPTGRINLQDIRTSAGNGERSLTDASERAAVAAVPVAAPEAVKPLPPIRINALVLSGGRVRFTDNFIRPNYSATLQELGGAVNGLSSAPDANADVTLRGLVNGAPLSIAGRINPLKRDLFLDVKAEVRGIEMATLSAYADKYVGYGIDKGKLSFEVAYLLENRQLKSDNRLIMDQLAFGKETSNPDVKRLPVGLAVALLSDRNGVIDISVPVGGTLDDPEFSIGGIILKVVGNAIMKTVTSPFALLASAFGGDEELSSVDFEAGRATITTAAEAKLVTLAKALLERPGLKLDIVGHADPARDIDALKQVSIERKLRTLKTRDLQGAGEDLPSGGVVVSKEEYPSLLSRVFKAETFKKPRNALGLEKTLTVAEMEQLMIANAVMDDDDLRSLARRRSQAAKEWLLKTGKIADERLYIVASHLVGKDAPPPSPRADFALR